MSSPPILHQPVDELLLEHIRKETAQNMHVLNRIRESIENRRRTISERFSQFVETIAIPELPPLLQEEDDPFKTAQNWEIAASNRMQCAEFGEAIKELLHALPREENDPELIELKEQLTEANSQIHTVTEAIERHHRHLDALTEKSSGPNVSDSMFARRYLPRIEEGENKICDKEERRGKLEGRVAGLQRQIDAFHRTYEQHVAEVLTTLRVTFEQQLQEALVMEMPTFDAQQCATEIRAQKCKAIAQDWIEPVSHDAVKKNRAISSEARRFRRGKPVTKRAEILIDNPDFRSNTLDTGELVIVKGGVQFDFNDLCMKYHLHTYDDLEVLAATCDEIIDGLFRAVGEEMKKFWTHLSNNLIMWVYATSAQIAALHRLGQSCSHIQTVMKEGNVCDQHFSTLVADYQRSIEQVYGPYTEKLQQKSLSKTGLITLNRSNGSGNHK